MTETEQKTCTCAEPELRVYSTRHTADSKVQYRRCKKCGLPAGKLVECSLAKKIAELVAIEMRRLFRA